MNKAHVIKLKPTKSQEQFFRRSCGVARFTYNWALVKRKEDFEKGIKWGAYDLVKHLNSIKREQFPWMLEVGKTCCQYPIHDLDNAYKRMYKGLSKYPRFKKKGIKDSFVSVENKLDFKQKDFKIWIPRLGWVRCCENLRFEGKVNNVVIKRKADMWFACINIETQDQPTVCENQATVGLDLGIKTLVTLSDGKTFENPKALKANLKSLKRLQRSLSRKKKRSNNRKKAQVRLARKHMKVANLRSNALHQATSFIVDKYDRIVIEDLNVGGMQKNRKVAQAIGDASFSELRRQLTYKALWQGKELVIASQWFASSKTCSNCGHKKQELKLSDRVFSCSECGFTCDRDLNAAINLANYSPTCELQGREACGEGSSAFEHSPSVKQEKLTF